MMWDVLKSLNEEHQSAARKDLRLTFESETGFVKRDQLIYLYAIQHEGFLLWRKARHLWWRYFHKHRFQGVCLHCKLEDLELSNYKEVGRKQRELMGKIDRVLKKAENCTPKLVEVKDLHDGFYEDGKKKMERNIRLTQAGEDFVEFEGLLKKLWDEDWKVMTGIVSTIIALITSLTLLIIKVIELAS